MNEMSPKRSRQSNVLNQPENVEDVIKRLCAKAAAVEKTQRLVKNTATGIRTTKTGKENGCSSLKSKTTVVKDNNSSKKYNTKATHDDERSFTVRRSGQRNDSLSRQRRPCVLQIHRSCFQVREPMSLEEIVACLHLAISKTDSEDCRRD